MGISLRRFMPRAPRYVLRPEDSQLLYFAPEGKVAGEKHPTKIVNVSETGVAFVVDKTNAPRIGDLIKIEFPVPGAEQIAWWARVVRMEEYSTSPWWKDFDETSSSTEILVGISFEHLPAGHRREIKEGIWNRYQDLIREHRRLQRQRFVEFAKENFWHFVLFALCATTLVMTLYWLSTLEPLFDIIKGSKYLEMWEKWSK